MAAKLIAGTLERGGVLHVFGSGHSHMLGEELFNRRGGLVPVNPIVDRVGGSTENLPGYGKVLLEGHDLRPGEVLVVVSTTGVSVLPIEVALEAKARGLKVVAVTSRAYSRKMRQHHPSAKRLYDVADVVLDNLVPRGDTIAVVPGLPQPVGPSSSILGMALVNAVVVEAIALLAQVGFDPPIQMNREYHGAAEHNAAVRAKYRDRIRATHTAMLFW